MDEMNSNINIQYLTFYLGDEVYAIDIANVREVLEFTSVTKVPNMPEFMRGIINLRGGVVPIVDLRLKFGMSPTEKALDTCIIILDIRVDEEKTVLGIMADKVKEVIELTSDRIEPPPRIGLRLDTGFIYGMGKTDDEFIIILNIYRVFKNDEINQVNQSQYAETFNTLSQEITT